MAEPEIVVYDPAKHHHILPALVELHVRCIQFDKALLRFHPPFTASQREKMLSFWKERHEQAALNRMTIILSLANVETSVEIAGVVELATPEADTGPFRADIEMLMVSPDYRRGGIGKQLMNALEGIAIARDRTLLQLLTTAGSAAEEYFYPRLGYIKCGRVPNFGISPADGQLVDGVYFYKHLKELTSG